MFVFNDFVLFGLILRVLLVLSGVVLSVREVGINNIKFLIQYIRSHALLTYKLFYWFVIFASIVYFEYLVSDANDITFSEAYAKNWFLSLLVTFLLFGVLSYAFVETKNSIAIAKKIKNDLKWGKGIKAVLDVIQVGIFFVPGGIFVRIGVTTLVQGVHMYLDSTIEGKVSEKIIKNIEIMLIIALINLSIILISAYIITDKIVFW